MPRGYMYFDERGVINKWCRKEEWFLQNGYAVNTTMDGYVKSIDEGDGHATYTCFVHLTGAPLLHSTAYRPEWIINHDPSLPNPDVSPQLVCKSVDYFIAQGYRTLTLRGLNGLTLRGVADPARAANGPVWFLPVEAMSSPVDFDRWSYRSSWYDFVPQGVPGIDQIADQLRWRVDASSGPLLDQAHIDITEELTRRFQDQVAELAEVTESTARPEPPAGWCKPLEWFKKKGFTKRGDYWFAPNTAMSPSSIHESLIGARADFYNYSYRPEWIMTESPLEVMTRALKAERRKSMELRKALASAITGGRNMNPSLFIPMIPCLAPTGKTAPTELTLDQQVKVTGPNMKGNLVFHNCNCRVISLFTDSRLALVVPFVAEVSDEALAEIHETDRWFYYGSLQPIQETADAGRT